MKKDIQEFKLALAYDDVLLVPHYSDIGSRKEIGLKTSFSKRIHLNMPIISANMDTVTGADMAIAMAREGGLGIIHRFQSIEEEADEIRKVKRAESFLIQDPITISREATLREALDLMANKGITGIIITSPGSDIEGILTARDFRFKTNLDEKIANIMTPQSRVITASKNISDEDAMKILDEHKIEKLPLVNEEGKLVGLITATDYAKAKENPFSSKDKKGRLLVGAALGVKDGLARAEALIEAGADVLVVDIAHGHHKKCLDLTQQLKKRCKGIDIVAGNVATAEGTLDLIKAGADGIKVGIGPGAACSTRIVTGCGIPQFTAVLECAEAARKFKVPIIADGGIKNSGDIAKAMGAGASTVMIGNLLSGTKESPGEYYIENGAAFKIYRGLASREALGYKATSIDSKERYDRAPEGIGYRVSYKGEVRKIVIALLDGLQSGMSYTGAKNLQEFEKKAEFICVTEAANRESMPRPNN